MQIEKNKMKQKKTAPIKSITTTIISLQLLQADRGNRPKSLFITAKNKTVLLTARIHLT